MNSSLLKSRKFWALILALLAAVAAYATGQVDLWQTLQAVIVALAAYSTGVAIEDHGAKSGLHISHETINQGEPSPVEGDGE